MSESVPPPSPAPDYDPTSASQASTEVPVPAAPLKELFIIGVGASAGGLDAVSELLRNLLKDTRLALVIVQHMDATHPSHLVELLGRVSAMPVQWAQNGEAVQAARVYVAPPKTCVTLHQGVMRLDESRDPSGKEIDFFFRSLAEDAKERAVGVILSGSNADGTSGLQAIQRAGGLVFAQDPTTAGFATMPRSAIVANCVNRLLTPKGIARELVKLTKDCDEIWRTLGAVKQAAPNLDADQLTVIFRLLLARTGVDFSQYKQTTIKRRLGRRMALTKVNSLVDYVKLAQRSREETDELYESLLINVTEFFRDSDNFDFLRTDIVPSIISHHGDGTPIRVWVPGCSTGEEAYSIAIIIRELLKDSGTIIPVQIFGTDISDTAISAARAGCYSGAEVTGVSPERLQRFFIKTEDGYMVQKPIRDMCVFARQNVVRDSPFSRLDLISCRNLMIYLSPQLQRKLMPIFHYSLVRTGYLFLGNSESIGAHADLFRIVDRRFRIYSRKSTTPRTSLDFAHEHLVASASSASKVLPTSMVDDLKEPSDIIREADRIVLARQGPTGVLVNDDLEILQFRGEVSPYLAPVSGRASLNVLRMAREGLTSDVEAALREAREQNIRIQRSGVRVMRDEETRLVDIDVTPIDSGRSRERFYLVLFSTSTGSAPAPAQASTEPPAASVAQIDQLRQDLRSTRGTLQSIIERHEVANQELRAANEEVQSSNEELQSTNEELETAKEELQSTNEELTTVNEELHNRQLELMQLNDDLQNLINTVHSPIIILGQDLRIRRFTPMAQKVLNVIPTDIGRPLSDINIKLAVPDLPQLIGDVMESLTARELEVQDTRGAWYSLRLRPYKTAENKIEGVVLTLIEIDQMKRTMADLEEARNLAQAVMESTREALAVLTAELRIQNANDAFYSLFHISREQAENRSFFEVVHGPDGLAEFRNALSGILPTGGSLTTERVCIELPGAGPTGFLFNARPVSSGIKMYPLYLLTFSRA
jgi:two-component system CheB/CheR fusion protein